MAPKPGSFTLFVYIGKNLRDIQQLLAGILADSVFVLFSAWFTVVCQNFCHPEVQLMYKSQNTPSLQNVFCIFKFSTTAMKSRLRKDGICCHSHNQYSDLDGCYCFSEQSEAFGTTAPVLREGLGSAQSLCSLWARPPSLSISSIYCFY